MLYGIERIGKIVFNDQMNTIGYKMNPRIATEIRKILMVLFIIV
jgi:hypothetical protein